MSEKNPHVIVIAGPNGAGKSTTAPMLLKGTLGVTEFVNADVIAQGALRVPAGERGVPCGPGHAGAAALSCEGAS